MRLDVPYPEPISADGSDRTFCRTCYQGRPAVLIRPAPGPEGIREARSYFQIGTHLKRNGVRVPEILYYNEGNGDLLVEDLGDCLLYSVFMDEDVSGTIRLYRAALRTLAVMQVMGSRGFDKTWCFDTPFYDSNLAWEREALYFTKWFLGRYLGMAPSDVLEQELHGLCDRVDDAPGARVFLHRDFQSRNLMLYREDIWIIDFQGGRLGPVGYDLASLLTDPYVDMDRVLWSGLIRYYHEQLTGLGFEIGFEELMENFRLMALLRTMQVLGAYSFLQIKKGRSFFRPFVAPALRRLRDLVSGESSGQLRQLRKVLEEIGP